MEDLSEYTDADDSTSAPTEVLAEFLSAVMTKDYANALKHCQLILSYEPRNSTVKEFYPLIIEKLKIIEGEGTDESSSDLSGSEDSTGTTTSNSRAVRKGKSDSERTTASYSSLEDDDDDFDDCNVSCVSETDIRNGNANVHYIMTEEKTVSSKREECNSSEEKDGPFVIKKKSKEQKKGSPNPKSSASACTPTGAQIETTKFRKNSSKADHNKTKSHNTSASDRNRSSGLTTATSRKSEIKTCLRTGRNSPSTG